jgi:hypothetical protein
LIREKQNSPKKVKGRSFFKVLPALPSAKRRLGWTKQLIPSFGKKYFNLKFYFALIIEWKMLYFILKKLFFFCRGVQLCWSMPKTGLEPIIVSYKETVLPIKLFRLFFYYPLPYPLGFTALINDKQWGFFRYLSSTYLVSFPPFR